MPPAPPRPIPPNGLTGVGRARRSLGGVLGGLAGIVALSAVAGTLAVVPLAPALALGGQAASSAVSLFNGIPGYLEIDRLMLPTTIYAKNPDTGEDVELTSFYDQNRVPVNFEQVSPVMYDAVLSAEDPRYYRHGGVDLIGTTRALLNNAQGDTTTQGGSSISQQYVKNVLVQRCEREAVDEVETDENGETVLNENGQPKIIPRDQVLRSCWEEATTADGVEGYQRKLQEIRYAIELEREYSKPEILLGYLNIANFGGTTYGIEAAARFYFNVSASQLSVGQAAILAGIVQNPNSYRIDRPEGSMLGQNGERFNKAADQSVDDVTPGSLAGLDTLLADGAITEEQYLAAGDAYSATKGRQLYVLDRMREEGRITAEQYLAAAIEPISPQPTPAPTGCVATSAPFFCQYVVNTVRNDPAYAEAFGDTPDERRESLTRDGLKIYTTLDWRMQNAASDAMNRYTPDTVNGMQFGSAAVSIQAGTGRILSIAQNNNFSEDADLLASDPAYTSLVYAGDAVHGVSKGFQTGSTFKLFTLVDWLEKGHSLYESVNGTLRPIPRLENRCDGPWVNREKTVVNNFGRVPGFRGTPMQFTAASLNTGFLGMAEKLDMCDIEDLTARMGVTTGDGARIEIQGAASLIGAGVNIAPVTMASAYATVANNGVRCAPYVIDRVVDADGNELPIPGSQCGAVLAPEVASAAAFALQGVMRPGGTGSGANPNDGTPLIGKTGTHEAFQTWLVESSTAVTTAVWVGNWNGEGDVFRSYFNGRRLSDARTPMARDIQAAANHLYPGSAFPQPGSQFLSQPARPAPPAGDDDGQDADEEPPGGGGGDGGPDGGPGDGGGPGNGNGGGNGGGRGNR